MTQLDLVTQCLDLVIKKEACPKTTPREWARVLWYLHKKGWLYAGFENKKLAMVAGMYRVKEINEETPKQFPTEEKGNILFIPFFASRAEDTLLPVKLFKRILAKRPEISEIAFYKMDDSISRYKRQKKEDENGKG